MNKRFALSYLAFAVLAATAYFLFPTLLSVEGGLSLAVASVVLKAPSGASQQVFRNGSVGYVDNNGFLSCLITFVSDCLNAGYTVANAIAQLETVQYATRAFTTTAAVALTAAEFFGAQMVVFRATGGTTPSASSVPTAAALAAVATNMAIGDSYKLRIINNGSGTFPAFTAETGFTFTGTMTIATNTWRDFEVIRTAAATWTVQSIGTGTDS